MPQCSSGDGGSEDGESVACNVTQTGRRLLEFQVVRIQTVPLIYVCGMERLIGFSSSWYARTTHPTTKRAEANTFVDQCEKVKDGRSEGEQLERKQWEEMARVVNWVIENES
jgi:hypothetical protein